MTIPTVGSAEKPKEAQVLINPETMVKVEFKRAQRDTAAKQQRKVHAAINELIHSRRRRYLAMNIVVAIASLLVVVTGIFGGMYIYKWISYSSKVAAQGECTIRYHEELRIDGYAQSQVQPISPPKPPRRGHGGNGDDGRRRPEHGPPRRQPPSSAPQMNHQRPYGGANGRFVEKYNVLNANQEIFQVPQLGFSPFGMLPINIIHDFSAKLTAIVDVWNSRCFVKPLDPGVVPPRDFVDMIRRIDDGTYVPNVCLIRKHYRAQQPALDATGLTALRSDIITRSCSSSVTYQLVRIESASTVPPPVTQRSALIGAGNEDVERAVEVDGQRDDSEDEPPVVLGGDADPDNPRNQARRQRAKRSVPSASSSEEVAEEEVPFDLQVEDDHRIVKKPAMNELDSDFENELSQGDGDDVVMNIGFAGGEDVEVAFIHFDDEYDLGNKLEF